jgi:subtilase family serine protease
MNVCKTFILACALALASANVAQATLVSSAQGGVSLAVTLKYHRQADLDTLVSNQSDPSSPLYAKFLTPDEFRRYFAPTPKEYAQTIASLQSAGFTIARTTPNRTVIDVAGPAALVSRMISSFAPQRLRQGARAASTGPAVAGLPFVGSVVGGSSAGSAMSPRLAILRSLAATRMHRYGQLTSPAAGPLVGPDGGYAPAALLTALDFPVRHGYDGRGVNVADVIDGAPLEADIQTFLHQFGISRTGPATIVVPVDGGNGPDPDLADIDAEWIVASAPGAQLYAYDMAAFSDLGLVDAYNQVVSDNVVDVVNTSLSRCESDTPLLALAVQPILEQGAAQGIAFEAVSFGGVNVCGIPDILFPLVPADSADNLDVAGSNAIEDAQAEIVAQTGMPGSGGGISAIVPVFPEQQRIRGVDPSGRNTPDLSIVSEVNGSGASLYIEGGWNSALVGVFVNNAPMAGLLAEYQQMAHHRLGAVDRTLYHRFATHGYGQGLIDIKSGCNGVYLDAPVCAKRGYDLTSGVGSISNAYRLGHWLVR